MAIARGRSWSTPWLLVFDLDGTLIDSSLDLCNAVNAALAHVGAPPLDHKVIGSFIGDGATTLVQRSLQASSANELPEAATPDNRYGAFLERAMTSFLEHYRKHKLDNTRLYPGVFEALHALRKAEPGLLMAVLTNKPERPAREICDALEVTPFLFANYGGNSFPTKKPEPEGLLEVMRQGAALRALAEGGPQEGPREGVVMIGDSDVDVLTARRANVSSLGCTYGLSPAKLAAAGPDWLCSSPAEWPDILLRSGARCTERPREKGAARRSDRGQCL